MSRMPVLLHSGLSAYCTELAAIEGKFADDSNRIGLHPAELRSSRFNWASAQRTFIRPQLEAVGGDWKTSGRRGNHSRESGLMAAGFYSALK